MGTGFHNQETATVQDTYYHVDKSLIGALVMIIIAILTQTGAFLWWASRISTTVEEQERRIVDVESWRSGLSKQNEEIVRLQVKYDELLHRVVILETPRLPSAAPGAKMPNHN